MEEIPHVLDVVDRELRVSGEFDHPRKQGKGRLAGAQGLVAILDEVPQRGAHGVVDEQAVPVNMQQRRDADTTKEEFLFREIINIEWLVDQVPVCLSRSSVAAALASPTMPVMACSAL